MSAKAKLKYVLFGAVFAGGFASLSLELAVMRQLSGFVGSTAVTASIIIGVLLAFMSLGYYRGSTVSIRRNRIRQVLAPDFIVIALMSVLASSYILIDLYFWAMNGLGIRSNVAQTFVYSLLLLSAAPYLFGKVTAVLSRYLHRFDRNNTGRIMAVDTVGSVLGSILTTLVLMPFVGVNHTVMLIAAAALLTAWLLGSRQIVLMLFIMLAAFSLNRDRLLLEVSHIVENNAVSTISVEEADDGRSKIMMMNGGGASKVSEDPEFRFGYVRFVEDNFISRLPQTGTPKKILIIGAGGFTMGLNDDFNRYTYVDVDASLKDVSEKHFLPEKLGDNKKFVVQDANQFLKESGELFDLIVLDTYSSRHIIPLDLVTVEYFARVKARSAPDGAVVMNIVGSPSFSSPLSQKIDNTIRRVFPFPLGRQVIGSFDGWCRRGCPDRNLMYVWYNLPENSDVYTINKNSAFYD